MRKEGFFKLVVLITALLAIGFFYFKSDVDRSLGETVFFGMLESLAAVFGIFALIIQNTHSKELDCASFIVQLNQNYIDCEAHQELISILEKNDPELIDEKVINMAIQHFDFFEPIYILLKKKIIDMEYIDDLFCYRFFSVANNPYIQKSIIEPNYGSYNNIIELHRLWKDYRKKAGNSVPFQETDLSLNAWYDPKPKHIIPKLPVNDLSTQKKEKKAVTVREAVAADEAELMRLYKLLLGDFNEGGKTGEQIENIKKDPMNYILVAECDGRLAGTIQMTLCASAAYDCKPHAVFEYVITDPDYRRMGIGKTLFEEAERIGKEKDVKFYVLVSGNTRKEAHKFYEAIGFDTNVKGFRIE